MIDSLTMGDDAAQTPAGLRRLNAMTPVEAESALHTCCGCRTWAARVAAARPFASISALRAEADRQWAVLGPAEWLEAFSHHPRIGETNLSQPRFAATAAQSAREQSGMAAADDDIRAEFLRLNAEYELRFGHVFLICATGRSADEMLAQLRVRLKNDPATELRIAAAEQLLITHIRLGRLVEP